MEDVQYARTFNTDTDHPDAEVYVYLYNFVYVSITGLKEEK